MGRMVVLRHELEDGTASLDVMFERPPSIQEGTAAERRVLTFRLETGVDVVRAAAFAGERIGDHRAVYLEYEGPVPAPGKEAGGGAGGGRVRRVASGTCAIVRESAEEIEVVVEAGGTRVRLVGRREGDSMVWRFVRA